MVVQFRIKKKIIRSKISYISGFNFVSASAVEEMQRNSMLFSLTIKMVQTRQLHVVKLDRISHAEINERPSKIEPLKVLLSLANN